MSNACYICLLANLIVHHHHLLLCTDRDKRGHVDHVYAGEMFRSGSYSVLSAKLDPIVDALFSVSDSHHWQVDWDSFHPKHSAHPHPQLQV